MPSIITITTNPCIDESTTFSGLKPDKKIRCAKPKFEPGGGGINVSRAINKLGGTSLTVYPVGGYAGNFLKELLDEENVESITINTKENTRENFIVVDTVTNNQYRFCMPGPTVYENEWHELLDKIESIIEREEAEYLVASGSLLPGMSADFFGRIAVIAKDKNVKFILDTSGEPAKYALEKGVYLWKPNLGELSAFSGLVDLTSDSAKEAAKKIIANGLAKIVVVSLGAGGAILVTKYLTEHFTAPLVKRKSTVGAGDSMVAGIVLSLSKGKTLSEAVKYGIACGTAATMNPGTELCRLGDVEQLYKSLMVIGEYLL